MRVRVLRTAPEQRAGAGGSMRASRRHTDGRAVDVGPQIRPTIATREQVERRTRLPPMVRRTRLVHDGLAHDGDGLHRAVGRNTGKGRHVRVSTVFSPPPGLFQRDSPPSASCVGVEKNILDANDSVQDWLIDSRTTSASRPLGQTLAMEGGYGLTPHTSAASEEPSWRAAALMRDEEEASGVRTMLKSPTRVSLYRVTTSAAHAARAHTNPPPRSSPRSPSPSSPWWRS